MGNSEKGGIAIVVGGLLYATVKLGDEFILVFDELVRLFSDSFIFRRIIFGLWRSVAEFELSLGTVVLGLLALFLLLAIADYISTEI